MVNRLLGLIILLTGLCAHSWAGARDLISERGVLDDPTGKLSISDVASMQFVGAEAHRTVEFSSPVHWHRIRVDPPARGESVVVRVRPATLDQVWLYAPDPLHPDQWVVQKVGDQRTDQDRECSASTLCFLVNVPAQGANFLLRVQSTGVIPLSVVALEPRESRRLDRTQDLLQVLFISLMLWALVWAVQGWLLEREPIFALFALHQAVFIAFGLGFTGYLSALAPEDWPQIVDLASNVLACAVPFTGALLYGRLLKQCSPPAVIRVGLDVIPLFFPMLILAIVLGYSHAALIANAVLMVGFAWFYVLAAALLREDRLPGRRSLRIVMWVLAIAITLTLPSPIGLDLHPDLALRDVLSLVLFGLLTATLNVALLWGRQRQFREAAQEVESELASIKRALDFERSLKEQAERRASTDYLTGLVNRRHFVDLAERELARAYRYERPLSLLMIDIDRFKSVNDTAGHNAGDEVLRTLANVLRDALREVDLIGRVGGEEFAALLLETEGAPAGMVAERVRAAVEHQPVSISDNGLLHVTVSIGLAQRHGRKLSLEQFMAEADRALYQAKNSGRNRVVTDDRSYQ